jgi:hypothetical protein
MNYVVAAILGLALGLLVPRLLRLEVGRTTSLGIGGASALAAYHVIAFTGVFPKGILGVALASVAGAALAFANLKPYFRPRLPAVTVVVRVFLGLFMLSSGVMMWMVNPQPGQSLPGMQPGPLNDWLQAVIDTGYLWQWIFVFKTVNGVLLLVPRTSTIGILAAFPYYVNLLIYTIAMAQIWLFLSVPAFLATVYLIFAHWDRYRLVVVRE